MNPFYAKDLVDEIKQQEILAAQKAKKKNGPAIRDAQLMKAQYRTWEQEGG